MLHLNLYIDILYNCFIQQLVIMSCLWTFRRRDFPAQKQHHQDIGQRHCPSQYSPKAPYINEALTEEALLARMNENMEVIV